MRPCRGEKGGGERTGEGGPEEVKSENKEKEEERRRARAHGQEKRKKKREVRKRKKKGGRKEGKKDLGFLILHFF